MAKLELNFDVLETIFDLDIKTGKLRLKPKEDGSLRTSINMQQFYNWYREKQSEFISMGTSNLVHGGGFIGRQPVVQFEKGFRIIVPEVAKFTVYGTVTTTHEGEFPFDVSPDTQLAISRYARPHAHIFLSYSSKNKPYVRELQKQLYGVCDTFFDETDIKPGQSITTRLNEELERTSLLVLVHSADVADSDWVQKEWSSMLHMQKPLVVVKIDETQLPPLLSDLKYVNGISSIDDAVNGIVEALDTIP